MLNIDKQINAHNLLCMANVLLQSTCRVTGHVSLLARLWKRCRQRRSMCVHVLNRSISSCIRDRWWLVCRIVNLLMFLLAGATLARSSGDIFHDLQTNNKTK